MCFAVVMFPVRTLASPAMLCLFFLKFFLLVLFIAYREQTVSVGKWTRVDAIYEGSLIKIEVSPILLLTVLWLEAQVLQFWSFTQTESHQ